MKNIKLKGTKNTRDFGGLKNRNGKTLRLCCFLRSAALGDITKSDIDILVNDYNLKTVIDLRTDEEISEKADVAIDGVSYYHIPVFTEETAGITHEKSADKKELLLNLPDMSELYRTIVSDEGCVERLGNVFGVITDTSNNAVLWHCTEGKDRCGIVSALFLLMLDFDLDTIYEDYLFTNTAPSENAKKYYRLVRYLMRDRPNAERIKRLFAAERDYLDAAFDEINIRYGSVDNFLLKLGITDEVKAAMQSKYLI